MKRRDRDLEFLNEIGTLRFIKRSWIQFLRSDVASISEHMFRMAWIALVIAKHEKVKDTGKILKMVLVHDITESRTGDPHYVSRQYVKIDEEVGELREAAMAQDPKAMHHELGDLLLAVVNVARKLGVDAENALLDATRRFEERFAFIEDRLVERGKTPETSNLDEMDALWTDAKRALTPGGNAR